MIRKAIVAGLISLALGCGKPPSKEEIWASRIGEVTMMCQMMPVDSSRVKGTLTIIRKADGWYFNGVHYTSAYETARAI